MSRVVYTLPLCFYFCLHLCRYYRAGQFQVSYIEMYSVNKLDSYSSDLIFDSVLFHISSQGALLDTQTNTAMLSKHLFYICLNKCLNKLFMMMIDF